VNRTERVLTVLLRLCGAMLLLAVFAIPLPREWMAAIHEWLGLGRYPEGPLIDYLARSISGLYAIHGGLLFLCAADIRRYRPVIQYCVIVGLLFGATMLAIDLHAGMPMFWTACEGPFVVIFSAAVLVMLRNVKPYPAA
jgi:hypothetical protein